MHRIRPLSDQLAISLSLICTLHCLVFPLLLSWFSTSITLFIGHEVFHYAMVLLVIPVSFFALISGCRKHRRYPVLATGSAGLFLLILAVVAGHDLLGNTTEKLLTVAGAVCVAIAHMFNYYLCQHDENCDCNNPHQ